MEARPDFVWGLIPLGLVLVTLIGALFVGLAAVMAHPVLRRGVWSAVGLICAVGGVKCAVLGVYSHRTRVERVHSIAARAYNRSDAQATQTADYDESDKSDDVIVKWPDKPAVSSKSKTTKTETPAKGVNVKHAEASRPAWVTTPPKADGNTFYMVKKIGPYTTPVECDGEVTKVLQAALGEYVELYLGREASDEVQLSDDELRGLIVDRYQETLPIKLGESTQTMYQVFLKLAFDHETQSHIRTAANNALVMSRMRKAGTGFGGALCALALAYVGLRAFQPRQVK